MILIFKSQKRWLSFLLPTPADEDYVLQASGMTGPLDDPSTTSSSLRRLMDETSDLIDSPPFSHVITLILDAGFSLLVDTKIATLAYKLPPTSAALDRVHEIIGTDAKAKLANTLAVFSRQAHSIGSASTNEYLTAMESVKDLGAFAAVVYSSNFEYEVPDFTAESIAGSVDPAFSTLGTSALPTPAGPGKAVSDDPLPPGLDKEPSLIDGTDLQKAWERATQDRGEEMKEENGFIPLRSHLTFTTNR
jgi:peroxin-3